MTRKEKLLEDKKNPTPEIFFNYFRLISAIYALKLALAKKR